MPINQHRAALRAYSAVVLGSTGNVGREIVNLLSASPAVRQVVVVKPATNRSIDGVSKVREVVVPDMDELMEAAWRAAREIGATVGFCAIGVRQGQPKNAGLTGTKGRSGVPRGLRQSARRPALFHRGVERRRRGQQIPGLVCVRIIGEKEQAVDAGGGIRAVSLYKPSVILGNSNTPSYLNYVFPAVEWLLPLRYHSIHKNELARAMVEGTQQALTEKQGGGASLKPEVRFYEYRGMKAILEDCA